MYHRYIAIAVLLCALVQCEHPAPAAVEPVIQPPVKTRAYAKIDMLTSATGRHFKMDSAIIYSRSAQIYWYDDFDDGDEHFLKWGVDPVRCSDSINLRPFVKRTHIKTVIDSLVPGCLYYALFHRPYKRDIKDNLKFTFTTPAEDSVERPAVQ